MIVPLRRTLMRQLDTLLDMVEAANLREGPLPEVVADAMRDVGIEDLTPYGRVAAIWAKQAPLMMRASVEFFGPCTFEGCRSAGPFDGRCSMHMVRRKPA